MLRPTMFVGVGEFGDLVLKNLALQAFITTGSPDLYGIFKYLVVHRAGYAIQNPVNSLFGGIVKYINANVADEADRTVVNVQGAMANIGTAIDNERTQFIAFAGDQTQREDAARRLSDNIGLTEPLDVAQEPEYFIVGDASSGFSSALLPAIAEKFTLPYGMIHIQNDDNSSGFMYEFFTQMALKGTPRFNAIYVIDSSRISGAPAPSDIATYFTVARFLYLIQTVLDVPAKLVDVDSDFGKGNVLAFSFGGALSMAKEKSFVESAEGFIKALDEYLIWDNDHDNKCDHTDVEKEIDTEFMDPLVRRYLFDGWENLSGNDISGKVNHFIKNIFNPELKYHMAHNRTGKLYGPKYALCVIKKIGKYKQELWDSVQDAKYKLARLNTFTDNISKKRWEEWNKGLKNVKNAVNSLKHDIENLAGGLSVWNSDGLNTDQNNNNNIDAKERYTLMAINRNSDSIFVDNALKIKPIAEEILYERTDCIVSKKAIPQNNLKKIFLDNVGGGGTDIMSFNDESRASTDHLASKITKDAKNFYEKVFGCDKYYLKLVTGFGYMDINFNKRPGNSIQSYVSGGGEKTFLLMRFIRNVLGSYHLVFSSDGKRFLIENDPVFNNQVKSVDDLFAGTYYAIIRGWGGIHNASPVTRNILIENLTVPPGRLNYFAVKMLEFFGFKNVPVNKDTIYEFINKFV